MKKLIVLALVFIGGFGAAAALHLHGLWVWAPSILGIVLTMKLSSGKK